MMHRGRRERREGGYSESSRDNYRERDICTVASVLYSSTCGDLWRKLIVGGRGGRGGRG